MFNKNVLTNLIALLILVCGVLISNETVTNIGLFALSGALTNAIAVHMLFERVPLLYGSGVIVLKFEAFKLAIKELIMEQFFTKENIERFTNNSQKYIHVDSEKLFDKLDISHSFEALKEAVINSPFGGMLGMFGGPEALTPLKEPFVEKMKSSLGEMIETDEFKQVISDAISADSNHEGLQSNIEGIVQNKLDELTAHEVKNLVQHIIKEHLGWLVVWGGVFGGIIGALATLI